MTTLAFDIEGNDLLPGVDTIWCLGIADVGDPLKVEVYTDFDPKYRPLGEGLERLLEAERIVAHNGVGYDLPALAKICDLHLNFDNLWDTMVWRGLLNPEVGSLALEACGREQGYEKGDHTDFSRYSQEMVDYMVRDVTICANEYRRQVAEVAEWEKLGVSFTKAAWIEHRVQRVLARQSDHGFRFDVVAAQALEAELSGEKAALERELQETFKPVYVPEKGVWDYNKRTWTSVRPTQAKGNNAKYGYTKDTWRSPVGLQLFNPGSRHQVAQRLSKAFGWVPPQFNSDGSPKMDEKVLSEIPHPEAQLVARYMRVQKQLSMLSEGESGWLRMERNGRLHGYVRSCGCRTYRMSHSKPNLAQVDKKDKRMRACFLPDLGDVLVGVDASGLEMRLMAAHLFPVDNGAYGRTVIEGNQAEGTDAHTVNQKAVGLYLRDSAKTIFYAYLYGAADPKLGSIVVEDAQKAGKPRPKGSLAALGSQARKRLEKGIVGLDRLIAAAQDRAQKRKYLLLRDGRPVRTGKRVALNSLLQGDGAVLMKMALVLFDTRLVPERGLEGRYEYCANVHDEVQLTARPEYAQQVGEAFCDAIRLAGEELGFKVPFAGEMQTGASWAETH